MEQIRDSGSHILHVDPRKNRIYFRLSGQHLPNASDFIEDCEKASQEMTQGFTVLVDAGHFEQMPLQWLEISSKTQKILREIGLAATAEVVSEAIFQEMAHYKLSCIRDLEKEKMFVDIHDAENWLDSVSPGTEIRREDGLT
jgi:hypothetical protein